MKLKKYSVSGKVEASTHVGEFLASSAQAAEQMAWQIAHVSVCHQCGEHISDPEITELNAELIEDD